MASIVVPIYTQSPVNSGAGAQRSILMNIVAISLFCLFLNIRIPNSKTINYISSCTFGVYLFHEFIPIKNTIYHAIFKMSVDFETRFFGKAVLLLLTIFGVGIILETIRKLIDKPLFDLVDKHAVNFYEKVNNFFPNSEKGDVVDSPNLCSCVWIHMLMLVLVALFVGQLYYIKDGKINPYRYSIGLSIIIVFEVVYFLVRNKINKKKST